ncbi:FecR domain-containing protein [Paracandidimonas lactea]|uniref:FecR domain-containing protein n=1 Tax=Paracandidimonas lactea TaxID=2895524 RepID=UPI001F1EA31C|nr:FecR domain-containing protein [Paracandidimonas lactea]
MISRWHPFRIISLFGILTLMASLGLPHIAAGQPAGADGDYFLYAAEHGDTLIRLSDRYTHDGDNWRKIQQINNVGEPSKLPVTQALRIPFSMIPEEPSQARVGHVAGTATANGDPLQTGATVQEGDIIHTGARAFVTLIMSDGSSVSLPPSSTVHIERLRVFKKTRLLDSIFTVRDGGLESSVSPGGAGVGRFEVRTPVSITGVRGTQLRVRLHDNGSQSEIIHGKAILDTRDNQRASLNEGQGAATSGTGHFLGVRALLPAPELSIPERSHGEWVTEVTPVPGATRYLVRVTLDEAGTQEIYRATSDTTTVRFTTTQPGKLYVRVRAIDQDGVMGHDSTQAFVNVAALRTAFGEIIRSTFGTAIFLRAF